MMPSTFARILSRRLLVGAALSALATLAASQPATHWIVPFAPGGPADSAARLLTQPYREASGQPAIIENKPGAGGIIGSSEVAKAPADGSVLLFTTAGHLTNATVHKTLPYDTLKSFTPITKLTTNSGFVLLVPSGSRFSTVDQLIAAARAEPGKITYGSAGVGNTTHIVGALFAKKADLKIVHVPYRGEAITDLMAGHIDMLFTGSSSAITLVRGGKVKALATTADRRIAELPDVPTLAERGVKDVVMPAWMGLFGPKGLSPERAEKIAADMREAMKRPAFIDGLQTTPDSQIVGSTPAQFRAEVEQELARMKRDIVPLGIEVE